MLISAAKSSAAHSAVASSDCRKAPSVLGPVVFLDSPVVVCLLIQLLVRLL